MTELPDDAIVALSQEDADWLDGYIRGDYTQEDLHERYGNPVHIPVTVIYTVIYPGAIHFEDYFEQVGEDRFRPIDLPISKIDKWVPHDE